MKSKVLSYINFAQLFRTCLNQRVKTKIIHLPQTTSAPWWCHSFPSPSCMRILTQVRLRVRTCNVTTPITSQDRNNRLTTNYSRIFLMATVSNLRPSCVRTLTQVILRASTCNIIQPYIPRSPSKISIFNSWSTFKWESKLPTYNFGVTCVPQIVTYCTPFIVVEYLDATSLWASTTN